MKEQEIDGNLNENGIYKYYYSSGVLKDSGYVKNGLLHGKLFSYNKFGDIYTIQSYYKGKLRDQIIYENNHFLNYSAYNHCENLVFLINYKRNNLEKNYSGHLIHTIFLKEKYNSEIIDVDFLVAKPPNCTTEFKYGYIDKLNNFRMIKKLKPNEYNEITYKVKRNKFNDTKILNISIAFDTLTNKYIRDTLFYIVEKNGRTLIKN